MPPVNADARTDLLVTLAKSPDHLCRVVLLTRIAHMAVANAEEQRVKLGRQLHGVPVADLMTPVTAEPEIPVARFIDEVALRHASPRTPWSTARAGSPGC
jgi:hypothetical protein